MYVIDSLGWIEFFVDGPNSADYRQYLSDFSKIITPAIVLYEVYKIVKRERNEEEALRAAALIQQTSIIPLDGGLALSAADVSLKFTLPMADSIVYTTAIENGCILVTSDEHFKGLEKVKYLPKK
jgi:toxin FitB